MNRIRSSWCPALLLALVALAALPRAALAQGGAVRGTVVDSASRNPIAGAQVTVVGSTKGTLTNGAGEYRIVDAPLGPVTLRVQRIGFAAAERQVTLRSDGSVTEHFALRAVAATLSGVVVMGYGTSARADVSAATSTVSGAEIANTPTAGLDAALQGKAPGVQVVQNAGNPGNGISVRIRGPASLNAGNQPLYVVDGVPILQDNFSQLGMGGQDVTAVTGINPDEIASIDILKDAAAAAIYGSRASNGVVLITTKRGQSGRAKFSFNAYTGRQTATERLNLLNAQQYVEVMNESAANDGYDPDDYDFEPGVDDARSFDWQDAVFRSAPVSNIQLGVSGGSDRVQYYLSGSLFDQQGVVIGSGYQRTAGRLNVDFNATNRLSFRSSIGLSREAHDRIDGDGSLDGVVTNAIGMQPMRPIFRDDGSFAGRAQRLRYSNPVALASLNSTELTSLRALGNVEAQYGITDRVRLTGRLGMDVVGYDESQWESAEVDRTYAASAGGVGKTGHTTATKYLTEAFVNADAINTGTHKLTLLAGTSAELNNRELNFVRGEGFTSGFRRYVRNAANVTEYDGTASEHNLVSFFSRANYSFADRYLLMASLRADGSSRFGEDNRYGIFPAISGGWLISDENFAQRLGRLASVKLRASFGETGNEGIPDFASRGLATGAPYSGTPGIAANSLDNPELRWESTREVDLGTDVTILDGRVALVMDYYRRNTSDLLVERPIATLSGFSSIFDNVGNIRNSGVDLDLEAALLRPGTTTGLSWTSRVNLTFNRNRVTKLFGGQSFTTGINGRETSIVQEGEPLGSFYMYKFEGVDPATGDAILADIDGDGEITSSDRTIVGSPHAKYYGGLTNKLTWGAFDVNTFFQFSQGNKIFNMMRIFTDDGGCSYDNKDASVLRRWRQPGDVTDVPRMSYDCVAGADVISSRFIEDGSYVRFQELTLGYRLPERFAAMANMSNARLYVSGRNLHTWTKYSGYNPDVNSAGSDENVIMGTDYYAYPLARTWSFGVSAGW